MSLVAATGLRIGERLAVRWGAIDIEIGTLTVRESVFEGTFQRPKTQIAMRTIPLGPHMMAMLIAHRERTTRRRPEDLVIYTHVVDAHTARQSRRSSVNCSQVFPNWLVRRNRAIP